jgi:DNA-binding Lrp family transcriptional regulator
MIRAFLYIEVQPGREKSFLEKLMTYEEVKEAHIIYGQYDVLAVLELKRGYFDSEHEKVLKFVEQIRKMKDVQDTNTVMPSFSLIKRESRV